MTDPNQSIRIEVRISGRSAGVDTRVLEAARSMVVDGDHLMTRLAQAFPEFTTVEWETVFPVDSSGPQATEGFDGAPPAAPRHDR
jgi:hypothetical protein